METHSITENAETHSITENAETHSDVALRFPIVRRSTSEKQPTRIKNQVIAIFISGIIILLWKNL